MPTVIAIKVCRVFQQRDPSCCNGHKKNKSQYNIFNRVHTHYLSENEVSSEYKRAYLVHCLAQLMLCLD